MNEISEPCFDPRHLTPTQLRSAYALELMRQELRVVGAWCRLLATPDVAQVQAAYDREARGLRAIERDRRRLLGEDWAGVIRGTT